MLYASSEFCCIKEKERETSEEDSLKLEQRENKVKNYFECADW